MFQFEAIILFYRQAEKIKISKVSVLCVVVSEDINHVSRQGK